jgi:hypothetical protein
MRYRCGHGNQVADGEDIESGDLMDARYHRNGSNMMNTFADREQDYYTRILLLSTLCACCPSLSYVHGDP